MKAFRISYLFFGIMFICSGGIAETTTGQRDAKLSHERIENEKNQAAQNDKNRPVVEALTVVQETRSAIDFLDKNDAAQAKAALERTLGKTDVLLSSHPTTALVPLAVDIRVVDTKIDDDHLKGIILQAKGLMNSGKYQAARLLLRDIASEIDIVTDNIPIATYPGAIRAAARLIDDGKTAQAKEQLLAALHSIAIVETVVPLPIVRAQALVEEASEKNKGDKNSKMEALNLVNSADPELDRAEKLGYGKKSDFKELHASIKNLKDNLSKDKDSKGLLAKVKNSLQSLKEKITSI